MVLVVSGLNGKPVQAQLVDCRGMSAEGYKVLLDEFQINAVLKSDRDLPAFLNSLKFTLETKLEALRLENETADLTVVPCKGRRPAGTEFDVRVVDALNSRGVLLEVWGTLDATVENQEIRAREAVIGYMLVPVRHYEHYERASPNVPGLYTVRYAMRSPGPVKEMFEQGGEFDAFAAVAVGVKSLKVGSYDMALQYLCKAEILLDQAARARGVPTPDRKQKALMEYAKTVARDCVKAAQEDKKYKGGITLLPQEAPCLRGGQ
jgi:hypothetical protein